MSRILLAICAFCLCAAAPPAEDPSPRWTANNLAALARWIELSRSDALPELPTATLDVAVAEADSVAIEETATKLTLRLARMHLRGSAGPSARVGWNIEDTDEEVDLDALLDQSLHAGTLDAFFASMRPQNPEYASLRNAFDREADPALRAEIARNMERWRWMPRSLGDDYVLVNAAKFEAQLWRAGQKVGTWKVIVGKPSTPTPVFGTTITGVVLNPWWEIPGSIVRESVGALVRRNPSAARARGYVWSDGRYRQRPGPNNALGQMKLVMPNPYSVYMHDTPNKDLFEKEVRAFSHGCIRTHDAIGYAATLLEGVKSRDEVDAIVASGKTTTVSVAEPLPIYVTYFTVVDNGEGGVRFLPDIYHRDRRIAAVDSECAA